MRTLRPLAAGVVAVAALGLILVAWRMWSVRPAAEDPSGEETPAPPRLASRPDDFVGSRACVRCHADLAATFFAHPMGRSLGRVDAVTRIEHGSPGPVARDGDREYLVVEREGVTELI
jgi:mono/diheme cytochrome c family protein